MTATSSQVEGAPKTAPAAVTPNPNPPASPVVKLAQKILETPPSNKLPEKKIKASRWSSLVDWLREIWSSCFGKKKETKEKTTSSSSSSLSFSSSSSSTASEIKINLFEILEWLELGKPEAKKETPVVKDWGDYYLDYKPRDLKQLGLAIEELRDCPALKLTDYTEPKAESKKPHQVKNPIFFKGFPQFDISIKHEDLLASKADVIVNAANGELRGGSGIDGDIHAAGGRAYTREHWNLRKHYDAKYTSGYAAVIKAVQLNSPNYSEKGKSYNSIKDVIVVAGPMGKATPQSNAALYSCYYNSLLLAHRQGKKSIAFPKISTGIYGYPKGPAAEISLLAIWDFIMAHPDTQLTSIAIHSFYPPSPDKNDDRIALMFYQDAVNQYKSIMSMEIEKP